MGNMIKYGGGTSPNSIKSGNFNVGVNSTPTDLTGFIMEYLQLLVVTQFI